jgi:hypothetical protein
MLLEYRNLGLLFLKSANQYPLFLVTIFIITITIYLLYYVKINYAKILDVLIFSNKI